MFGLYLIYVKGLSKMNTINIKNQLVYTCVYDFAISNPA